MGRNAALRGRPGPVGPALPPSSPPNRPERPEGRAVHPPARRRPGLAQAPGSHPGQDVGRSVAPVPASAQEGGDAEEPAARPGTPCHTPPHVVQARRSPRVWDTTEFCRVEAVLARALSGRREEGKGPFLQRGREDPTWGPLEGSSECGQHTGQTVCRLGWARLAGSSSPSTAALTKGPGTIDVKPPSEAGRCVVRVFGMFYLHAFVPFMEKPGENRMGRGHRRLGAFVPRYFQREKGRRSHSTAASHRWS